MKIAAGCAAFAAALAAWAALDSALVPARSTSAWMPSGAQLYLESKDFAGLLRDWNSSREKSLWLKSDNYEVFSRSRLFGRLGDAQGEFAGAAGQQPDMAFLNQIAGKESGLALYDIGKLEFLYITHMPNAQAKQTGLMQSSKNFETRKVGDAVFYVKSTGGADNGSDERSGPARTVAFAISGDYLLLATREDLLAGALALMQNQNQQALDKDGWFDEITQASANSGKGPGDLRMVLDLSRLVRSPYFRSYWVQQNITEMGRYRAAISDLYREHGQFDEERVLLPKSADSGAAVQGDLRQIRQLVPEGAGYYRAESMPEVDRVLEAIDTRLLSRKVHDYNDRTLAPAEGAISTQAGTEDDLESRIDEPPAMAMPKGAELASLRSLLEAEQPDAMLVVDKSVAQADGVFVGYRSAVVLEAGRPWSASEIETAIGYALAPHLTAGTQGIEWKRGSENPGYYKLDGAAPLALVINGRYCMISDDEGMLEAMVQKANEAKPAARQAMLMLSGFNHEAEKADFARATHLIDSANASATTVANDDGSGQAPQFFSRNVASLSSTFAAMRTEEVSVYWQSGALHQTVRYEWK